MRILCVGDDSRQPDEWDWHLRREAPVLDRDAVVTEREALARLTAREGPGYDLVLIAVGALEGAGPALLDYIRQHSLPVAVVLLLERAAPEVAAAALAAGADGCAVLGAGSPEELGETLARALLRQRAEWARRARPLKVLYAAPAALAGVRRHLLARADTVQFDWVPTAGAALGLLARPGRQTGYDVLLLAHHPPELDAHDCLREVRGMPAGLPPVVVLVPPGAHEAARQSVALGAYDALEASEACFERLVATLERAGQADVPGGTPPAEHAPEDEDTLHVAQRRHALATAASGVGVWDRDLATGVLQVDPALLALLGFGDDERGAGDLWWARTHPDDRERLLTSERAALDPDAPRAPDGTTPIPEIEYRALHRDGTVRWFLNRGTVLRRADGTPHRVIGTATGITARKEYEFRLAMEYTVNRALAGEGDLAAVAHRILYHVATSLRYDYAALWLVDARHGVLRCVALRRAAGPAALAFEGTSRDATCAPGVDLPGRAWRSGHPAAFAIHGGLDHSPRMAAARDAGFAFGLGYPIRHGDTVIGVLELFRHDAGGIKAEAFATLRVIGAQIGQFVARKQTEEALRESDEFRARVLESAVTAIWALDRAGRITLVNQRVTEITGYAVEELRGRTSAFLVPPDQRDAVMGAIAMTLQAGGRITRYQTEVIRNDGTSRWISFSLVPLMDGDAIVGAVATAEDITNRRQTEEALRASEARYRDLFEQAADPILLGTVAGALLDANARACALLGYARTELARLTTADVIVTTPAQRAATRAVLRAGGDVRVQRELRRKDGTTVPVELYSRALADGRVQAIARDISERLHAEAALRASEARFRALYQAEVIPIWFWHADGRVTEANDAYLALVGFSRAELAAGVLRWDALVAPEHRERDRQARAEAAEHGALAPHEKDYVLRDGRRVAILCGGAILREDPERGVAFAVDLTGRKRAEAQLRELSARLLEAQDEERRRIARDLHDVTSQDVFALSMLLARLAQPAASLDAPARTVLAEARALGDKVLRDLRTQSYLLHPPLLDELGLVAALEWFADGFARRSGIAVDLALEDLPARLPPGVELALFRVAQEGLANVHRHAGSSTARIALAREGGLVALRIADDGRGLPGAPEEVEVLLGVGILGMRERLRQIGGQLAIASDAHGTTVTAVVPLPDGAEA